MLLVRRLTDKDGVRRRSCLQARRCVGDVAGHKRLRGLGACRNRHQSFAGVDADADVQIAGRNESVTNLNRRPNGALGVVLVSNRRTEDSHHRITNELLHSAAVALELVPHATEVRELDPSHILRIEGLRACRKTDNVDKTTVTVVPLLPRRPLGQRCGAGVTKPRLLRVLVPATCARCHKCKGTTVWPPRLERANPSRSGGRPEALLERIDYQPVRSALMIYIPVKCFPDVHVARGRRWPEQSSGQGAWMA